MKNYVNFFSSISGHLLSGSFKVVILKSPILIIVLIFFLAQSCERAEDEPIMTDLELAQKSFDSVLEDPDNMVIHFPDEDPGIPIYGRVGPILNQFFVAGDQLVIPFYRNPVCIPESFNLLNYYDPPAAFGCELKVQGSFVIEKDAEEGQFPIMAYTSGTEVPVWIVDWAGFQLLMEEGTVTIVDLEELNPIKATAFQYEEYLSPRINEHQVIIVATGSVLDSDEDFYFSLTHNGDQIKQIQLEVGVINSPGNRVNRH